MKSKNNTLVAAIVFAAVAISGSLLFFGLQFSRGAMGKNVMGDSLAEQIDQGIQRYVAKQQEDQAKSQQDAAKAQQEKAKNVKKVSKETDHIRGNTDAKITLIEYSDFECPFCKSFHPTAMKAIEEYKGQVNWVYRYFPLGFHNPLATKEALASECASELGGNEVFWKYADELYSRTTSNGKGLAMEELPQIAKDLGLNVNEFQTCLDSEKYKDRIQQDIQEGSQAGITGTPGNILLNNETGEVRVLAGAVPFETVKSAVDEMLK